MWALVHVCVSVFVQVCVCMLRPVLASIETLTVLSLLRCSAHILVAAIAEMLNLAGFQLALSSGTGEERAKDGKEKASPSRTPARPVIDIAKNILKRWP